MNIQEHLTQQLKTALNPHHLEVINESDQHSGTATESHFKIVAVSDFFEEMRLIDRHRFINQLFKQELQQIHALAMHTYTNAEWQKRQKAPDSPKCQGGK